MELPKLPVKGYVIWSPLRNMYSKGSDGPSWSKKAKIWTSIGGLSNHFAMFYRYDYTKQIYEIDYNSDHKSEMYYENDQIFEISENKLISTVGEYVKELIKRRLKSDILYYKKNLKHEFSSKNNSSKMEAAVKQLEELN